MKPGVKIWRDEHGIPHVHADSVTDMFWGQGYVHATDRGLQLLMMRILGQGRASELLDSSDETLQVDIFFRRMNWGGRIQSQMDALPEGTQRYLTAYCEGVNAALARKVPWELKLLGYHPEPWRSEDSIMISRMIGYLTLAQSQTEIERLFVEMVQAGVDEARLKELFPIWGELDVDLLQKVTLNERIVPPQLLWQRAVPRMMASNNWVIAGQKTASGKPIMANDPHLETNRLPNVWSEIVLQSEGRYLMGGSMPGFPGVLAGRTPDVAWGATYAFIDAVDSWVERCQDGKYYRQAEQSWHNFQTRTEIIRRKKKPDTTVTFFENEHGVLDGNPHETGYYLATRWAAAESGAQTLVSVLAMWQVSSVAEGMAVLGKIETGWNFVLADTEGNIGFQMSGLVPKRREGANGFIPLPGWLAENDWHGFHTYEAMPHILNPKTGFFATANNNLNTYGRIHPINMPMGSYRAERITQLLADGDNFTVQDVFGMHYDVYSLQAERFMSVLRPLLPNTPQGKILRDWDLCYTADSEGAYLFEQFYRALYQTVFGQNGIGEVVLRYLLDETGTFIDFYQNFDRVLLAEESVWFGGRSRKEIYQEAAATALTVPPQPWGNARKFTLSHMLFGGKMPRFLGFDRGPVTAIGNRATIHQGQIYRSAGRETTFFPSFRIVTDLAQTDVFSNLAGGPSDRRFSKWYCSDLENWQTGRYKKTTPHNDQPKLSFP